MKWIICEHLPQEQSCGNASSNEATRSVKSRPAVKCAWVLQKDIVDKQSKIG
jgi:hypothetical protein